MKRFRFRLRPVLDYRAHVEEMRRRQLALARRDLQAALHVRDEIARRLETALDRMGEAMKKDDHLRGAEIMAHRAYLQRLSERLEAASGTVAAARSRVEQATAALLSARRDRRILQRLYDKAVERYRYELARWEVNQTDDLTQARVARARLGDAGGAYDA